MTATDLVIFDCDGVLVDSEIIAARVEADLLTSAGFEISPEEISETYAGLTFKDIMLRIEEKSRIPFQASLIDQAEALVDKRLDKEVQAIEGARAAVASLTGPRCICSNSSPERLDRMLTRDRAAALLRGPHLLGAGHADRHAEAGARRVPATPPGRSAPIRPKPS